MEANRGQLAAEVAEVAEDAQPRYTASARQWYAEDWSKDGGSVYVVDDLSRLVARVFDAPDSGESAQERAALIAAAPETAAERDRLREQNAALLAALEGMLRFVDSSQALGAFSGPSVEAHRTVARAAIAAARG